MDFAKVPAVDGGCVSVFVEVPYGTIGAKYELDESTGFIVLDRVLRTPVHYPCNYGFIVNTKGGDGDALDVMLACSVPLVVGVIARARPLGILVMEDEKGRDEKILSVADADPAFAGIEKCEDLPLLMQQIEYFFARYKDLDSNKWSKVVGWDGVDKAWQVINEAL